MEFKTKMICNVVAHFADQGSEVVMVWPHASAQAPQDGILQGSVNLKMPQAIASQFVPGNTYEITMAQVVVEAAPVDEKPKVISLVPSNDEKSDVGQDADAQPGQAA